MRSRETLINDFANLIGGLHDRMQALVARHPDERVLARLDRLATRMVNDIDRIQRGYIYVLDKLEAAAGASSIPPAPRPSNVLSFRPSARRKR